MPNPKVTYSITHSDDTPMQDPILVERSDYIKLADNYLNMLELFRLRTIELEDLRKRNCELENKVYDYEESEKENILFRKEHDILKTAHDTLYDMYMKGLGIEE